MNYISMVKVMRTISWFLHGEPHSEDVVDWYWSLHSNKCPGCGE